LIAKGHSITKLILGAWGTGVFQNEPKTVFEAFNHYLQTPSFAGAFEEVTFALYGADMIDLC